MRIRVLPELVILGTMLAAAGCHFQVQKGKNGEDQNVRIQTPLGGLNVRSNQTTAADLGLPVYPGAKVASDDQGDQSADVNIGFGPWQMHVEVVTYQTPDAQKKVIAFYKNALGRFGDVLTCQGDKAIGTPTVTREGLTCNEDKSSRVHVGGVDVGDDNGFTLRAGSKHHQHIFALKSSGLETQFSLIELELPESTAGNSSASD